VTNPTNFTHPAAPSAPLSSQDLQSVLAKIASRDTSRATLTKARIAILEILARAPYTATVETVALDEDTYQSVVTAVAIGTATVRGKVRLAGNPPRIQVQFGDHRVDLAVGTGGSFNVGVAEVVADLDSDLLELIDPANELADQLHQRVGAAVQDEIERQVKASKEATK